MYEPTDSDWQDFCSWEDDQKLYEIGEMPSGYILHLRKLQFEIFCDYPPHLGGQGVEKFEKMCREGWLSYLDAVYLTPSDTIGHSETSPNKKETL